MIVVGLNPSTDQDTTTSLQLFQEQTGVTFPLGIETTLTYSQFRTVEAATAPFPVDVIIDADGVVAYARREYDFAAMQQTLDALLAQ